MTAKIIHCPSHTRSAFDISTMPLIVRWAEEQCLRHRIDAIVACGHSGLLVAGAVMYSARIPVFAVRKEGETTVAGSGPVSGVAPAGRAQRWAWLDDFISSGGTLRRAVAEVWDARLVERPWPELVLSYARTLDEPGTLYTIAGSDFITNPWGYDKDLQLDHALDRPLFDAAPSTIPHVGFRS